MTFDFIDLRLFLIDIAIPSVAQPESIVSANHLQLSLKSLLFITRNTSDLIKNDNDGPGEVEQLGK